MATTDQEGNKCPPARTNICACGPLICTCSAPASTIVSVTAMDQEGNNLPEGFAPKLSVLSPSPPLPRASPLGPTSTPCTRWGVIPAAASPPLSPLLVKDFAKVYEIAMKTKQQLDSAQMEIKKMSKVHKSRKRKADSMISVSPAATEPPRSSLCNSWTNLMMQLRSQSSFQMQEMRATIAAKDSQLKYQQREIERLNTKVATLTHDNNLAHLSLQQNMSTYSSITGSVFDSTLSDGEHDPVEETLSPDVSYPEPEILENNLSPDESLSLPAQTARRQEESSQIFRMLDSVDKLAKLYSPKDRYHNPYSTNVSQPRAAVNPFVIL